MPSPSLLSFKTSALALALSLPMGLPLGLGLGLALGAGCGSPAGTASTAPEQALRGAPLSMSDAIDVALAQQAGTVVGAEFEGSGDKARYEVEILADGAVHEVFVDPQSGAVISTQVDPEDLKSATQASERLAGAALSIKDAVAKAEDETGGQVFEVELEDLNFELSVLTDAGPVEVLVKAADGSVSVSADEAESVEDNDDEDEDEDDDEDQDTDDDDDDDD